MKINYDEIKREERNIENIVFINSVEMWNGRGEKIDVYGNELISKEDEEDDEDEEYDCYEDRDCKYIEESIYDHLKVNVLIVASNGRTYKLSVAPIRYFYCVDNEGRDVCTSLDADDIIFQFLREEVYKFKASVDEIADKSIVIDFNTIDREDDEIDFQNPLHKVQAMLLYSRRGYVNHRCIDKFNLWDHIDKKASSMYEYCGNGLVESERNEIMSRIENDDSHL